MNATIAIRNIAILTGVAALVMSPLARAGEGAPTDVRARNDYTLHCSGCHLPDGTGNPAKGIPRFTNQIGYFLRLPEGREFLMQVPGLLGARLSDERAAAVMNYVIRRYGEASLPSDFIPYSASEAKLLRESRPANIMAKRNVVYTQLVQEGLPVQ